MNGLLSLLRTFFAVVWTLVSCTVALVCLIPGESTSRWVLTRIGGGFWSRAMMRLLTRKFEIIPPPSGHWPQRAIYIANHSSQLDINAIFASIPHPVIFLSKASIKRMPFLGWANSRVGTVFVERGNRNSALQAAKDMHQQLDLGKVIFVFPEGTRSPDGELLPFKKGAFILALDAQVPIVPLWISGTQSALPKGSFLIQSRCVQIRFGEPIFPEHLQDKGGADAFAHQAKEAMLELKAQCN